MNMKKFLTVLILGLAVFAVSCSENEPTEEEQFWEIMNSGYYYGITGFSWGRVDIVNFDGKKLNIYVSSSDSFKTEYPDAYSYFCAGTTIFTFSEFNNGFAYYLSPNGQYGITIKINSTSNVMVQVNDVSEGNLNLLFGYGYME